MFDFLSQKFSGVLGWLKDKGALNEKNIEDASQQVREALLLTDVPYDLIEEFLKQIKKEAVDCKISNGLNSGQQFIKIVHNKLLYFLGGGLSSTPLAFKIPSVLMMMGLQGCGKTTTVAKLAWWILKEAKKRNKKRRILLASVDFYRPAAINQLALLAGQVGVDFYKTQSLNPASATEEIHNYFKKNCYEHLLLDTAGRLHIDDQMIDELKFIDSRLAPSYKVLVLDAMTGQESLKVARAFDDKVGFQNTILTKMDSDARGGAAFSFRFALKKPVNFVGFGEKKEDIEPFVAERMASRILGMGDIITLIEKAEENVNIEKQKDLSSRFLNGNFSLEDFATQIGMVEKMGSFGKIMRYIPGASQISSDKLEEGQKEMEKFKVVISSMTKKERLYPQILDASRKQRIARGSGSSVQDVNKLLQRFEQSKQMVQSFKKLGKFGFFR